MLKDVADYALINAKLRARISTILSKEFFATLMKSPSITEMVNLLRPTSFAGLCEVYDRTGDLKMVELELFRIESALFTDIAAYLPAEVQPLSRAFTIGYEVENCKNALRLLFDHIVRKRPIDDSIHYLIRDKMVHQLPFDAIINSSSFDEAAKLLEGSPYGRIVRAWYSAVEQNETLFPLSTALDRHYYAELTGAAAALPRRDREIALRLIGTEIDLQNCAWVLRFRTYYRLGFDAIAGYIIPGGLALSSVALRDIYESQHIDAPLAALLRRRYRGMAALMAVPPADISSRLQFIESVLEQLFLEEVYRIMRGYPFTVGIVLAYYILKRTEIRKIRTLLNAGYYHLSSERTASVL